jgi:thioredoxin-related protein
MRKIVSLIVLIISVNSFSQNWKTNFEEVKTEATASNKKILLVFSGSDWCAPCIKLDRNIWQSKEFKAFSDLNYILYKADFPKKKGNQLPEELRKQNLVLAEKYNQNGNYPLVVLLDNKGTVLGMTGFKNVSPMEYIELLKNLEKK